MQANGHHLRLSEGVQNKQTAVRKTERAGTVSPSQEKARGRGQPVKVCKCLKRGCKEDRARLLSVVPSDSTRAMCPNWNTGGEHQETLFHYEDDQALEQVAQGCCGVSILRDVQKPSGPKPGQLALGGPTWAVGLDRMTSAGYFQPQPIYDSVNLHKNILKLSFLTAASGGCYQCTHIQKVFGQINRTKVYQRLESWDHTSASEGLWIAKCRGW